MPLAAAQEAFAKHGQMLALDPPARRTAAARRRDDRRDRRDRRQRPARHRYGGPRDLVVGATVALADGTIAKSGGTVIKNVAGYDIAKLMAGSFGTLGLILSVNVRLHPLPEATATVVAGAADPRASCSGRRTRWRRRRPSSRRSMSAGVTAAARCWRVSPDRRASRGTAAGADA